MTEVYTGHINPDKSDVDNLTDLINHRKPSDSIKIPYGAIEFDLPISIPGRISLARNTAPTQTVNQEDNSVTVASHNNALDTSIYTDHDRTIGIGTPVDGVRNTRITFRPKADQGIKVVDKEIIYYRLYLSGMWHLAGYGDARKSFVGLDVDWDQHSLPTDDDIITAILSKLKTDYPKFKLVRSCVDIDVVRLTDEEINTEYGGDPLLQSAYLCKIIVKAKENNLLYVDGDDNDNYVNIIAYKPTAYTPPVVEEQPVQPEVDDATPGFYYSGVDDE